MAPTTFDELVAHQQEVSAERTRAHGEVKSFSDKVVERFGVDWGDDLEGLRWRAQCVQRHGELSREIGAKDAEVRRLRSETVEIKQTRARNMAEFKEIMELTREAAADPWVLRGLKEIVEAHSGEDDAVGGAPDFMAMEKSIGECCSGLVELQEETARNYESEIAVLEARLRQKNEQIQAQDQALQELSAEVQAKDKEADARTKMIQARDAKTAEMEESLRGLRVELVAEKALVDDSVEEKMAAARERYHAHETLRQEVLRANRLQREVEPGENRIQQQI